MLRTLKQIHARCIPDGDCLRWQGGLSKSAGHPKINDKSGRRLVYELAHGPIPDKALLTITCECMDCLNPAHLALTNKAEVSRKVNASQSMRMRKAAASAKAKRPHAKLTIEQAREVRDSIGRCADVAALYGVHLTLVSKIRRGEAWRELGPNPFQGLGAR